MGLDLIYLSVLVAWMFGGIGVMLTKVPLLNVIFGFGGISLGGVALTDYAGDIPYTPYIQVLCMLVGVVCLLVVAVQGRHWGD